MKNVLIYGRYKNEEGRDFYNDVFGNHYIISLESVNGEQALPFIATVRDEVVNVDYISAKEIVMTYKDLSALRSQVIAQMEVDSLDKLNRGRA